MTGRVDRLYWLTPREEVAVPYRRARRAAVTALIGGVMEGEGGG
jgi:hypothetical protein